MAPSCFCRSEKLTSVAYTGAPSSHIYAVDSNRFYLISIVSMRVVFLSTRHQNLMMFRYCIIIPFTHWEKEKCKTLIAVEAFRCRRAIDVSKTEKAQRTYSTYLLAQDR